MILGIGTDIVEISRIQSAMAKSERFAQRILCPEELIEMHTCNNASRFVAKRFAAKEAVLKAFGTGIGNGMSWHMVHIKHDALGKPTVHTSGLLHEKLSELGMRSCHLSISDEVMYATAFAVIET